MSYKFIISGGGTGGHIFPAIAIANEIKSRYPDAEILFVGAKDRMEMAKVPEAGYKIEGLWISGIQRKFTFKNFAVPFKLVHSLYKAGKIVKTFKPDAVIGVGGYASAAILYAASKKGVPCLIQEQNSFAGITNKWLGKKVQKICVAYDGMERFFPKNKIIKTGNPVRSNLFNISISKEEALTKYGLQPDKKTVLITGGSLGARTLNEAIRSSLQDIDHADIQLIWQTGSFYYNEYRNFEKSGIKVLEFIKDMNEAYQAADLVVCRAGALTLAEICVLGKPSILVPSPFVTEDHQTHNAMQLVNNNAAMMIKDKEAIETLVASILSIISNQELLQSLSEHSKAMGIPDATQKIVNEIESIMKKS
ncbi:MAG: undecaprenyldiphospho-muramoylpentapeptide beta-N-acetylglucosaminyltransferase [Bacteroidetes bacterium]|nr:undecaprenyldiphospho-muramoylpentapeptide beta-N-acetylglucosaminyltransferase [Bacteroidota bacterium]